MVQPFSGYFNPRSPDGERPVTGRALTVEWIFQSTLPGWGATRLARASSRPRTDFNPRSPDGERPGKARLVLSIMYFNPRSPDGERHALPTFAPHQKGISIHAPRMGSDVALTMECERRSHFNPRSPDGERRRARRNALRALRFQSTLPGWGATQ